MNDYLAIHVGVRTARSVAHSALPSAPVVAEFERQSAGRWTAARLRAIADSAHHLADRMDPIRRSGRHCAA